MRTQEVFRFQYLGDSQPKFTVRRLLHANLPFPVHCARMRLLVSQLQGVSVDTGQGRRYRRQTGNLLACTGVSIYNHYIQMEPGLTGLVTWHFLPRATVLYLTHGFPSNIRLARLYT